MDDGLLKSTKDLKRVRKLVTLALGLYGKEWKAVERHIGTRSGA
jgi:hypothetical protein